ncbi:MAG: T9SS type A sorting domain-containing protein [Bacteroidetes bacterium]|nr:T9SS type A sorting domain-containing protein [Bacteroidota bacterium]
MCYDLSFNPQNTQIGFLAGVTNLFKTTDGGYNWVSTDQLGFPYFVDVNPYFPIIIFIWGTEDGSLGPFHFYRSFDGGTTWQDSLGSLLILEPQFHPDSSNIAYAHSATKILKTTDTGKTWSTILGTGSGGLWIEALRLHPGDPDIIYAGGSRLYKTTNGGEDWFLKDSALIAFEPDFQISSIWVDENTPGRLYVGLSNYSGNSGLFLTEDDGKSWKQIYDDPIYIIEADNESPRNIYCATNFGAIRLLDTFTVTGVNEVNNLIPEEFHLYQNYPNPFNPTTSIQYAVSSPLRRSGSEASRQFVVSLKVYDVLGSEVAALVNEEQPAGSYEIEFNASNLPSGVYFYELKVNQFYSVKKMILLR